LTPPNGALRGNDALLTPMVPVSIRRAIASILVGHEESLFYAQGSTSE
jgi:hypothetical protein